MSDKESIANGIVSAADKLGIIPVLYSLFGNRVHVLIHIKESLCDGSIEELNLDTRSHNALMRSKLVTIGQVVDMLNEGSIMRIRNLGKKSLVDIQTKTLDYAYQNASAKEKVRFALSLLDLNLDFDLP